MHDNCDQRLTILRPPNSDKHVMRSKFTDHMRDTVTLLSDIELNISLSDGDMAMTATV